MMKMNASMTRYQGLNVSICAQAMWQHVERGIKVRESACVDPMDFGPPDSDQTHS